MGTREAVLGVDSSTQSCKVEIRDLADGSLLGTGRAPHPVTTAPRSEQDPGAWWDALGVAVHGAMATAGDVRIVSLSVAGQQHGMVVLDSTGGVLRPAKLWNDTESAEEATELVAGRASRWARETGSVPVASFTVTKLVWLSRHEPDVLSRTAQVLVPHDWLTWRLTGRAVTDRGDASGTGYWSPSQERWLPDLLAECIPERSPSDWAACLPEVLGPIDGAGPILPDVATALGVTPGAIVGPGTGDNMAAALGVGLGPGDVAISIGTSGTVFAVSDAPTADATGAVAGFADATGRFLPLVCTLNATLVTEAIARLLGVDLVGLDALASTADAGSGGLVLVPYLAGERTPNRPTATGTLSGIRTDVERSDVARAAFEGVVCGLLDGLDALTGVVGAPPPRNARSDPAVPDVSHSSGDGRLVLVGGGARSTSYPQVLADLTGEAVTIPPNDELVALGACVQAAAVAQDREPTGVILDWHLAGGRTVEPDLDVDRLSIRHAYAAARGPD